MNSIFQNSKKIYQFTILYWLAVILGIMLWSRDWEIIRLGAIKQIEDLLGILAFWVFCAVTVIAYIEYKSFKKISTESLLFIGIPYFVSLFFTAQVLDITAPSWDYKQYEAAFMAIVDGVNPYASNRYLYPPTFAEMMILVYRVGLRVFSWLHIGKSEWIFVFYIHQALLLFSLLLSYFLTIEFAEKLGLKKINSLILVSIIYLVNIPVLRTISWNQVNFYVLLSILFATLLLDRFPFIAGVATTLGGLIKVYPFALSVPAFFMQRWKFLIGMTIGLFAVILLQTNFFRDFEIWIQFYNFYISFPLEQEISLFRNSSPMSVFRNTFEMMGISIQYTSYATSIIILLVLIWFAVRFYQRNKIILSPNFLPIETDYFRAIGHLLDFSIISLLIAPSAWEHHHVIAIPLLIWVFILRMKDAPIQVVLAFALVFALPVINIYPFSYLRLVGVLLLLILSSPKNIEKTFSI